MTGRRILITGGAGFIGRHLALQLAHDPHDQLVLLDDFSRGRRDAEFEALAALPNVRCVHGDVTDAATFERIGGEFDEVYHLAAIIGVRPVLERPQDVLRVNVLGTLHVVEWAARGAARRLLFASTSEVYGWTQTFHALPVPTPEAVPLALTDLANPRSSYAGSKIFGELLVTHACAARDLPFVIVRYHNVYGPRMGGEHVIPELFDRARRGQDPLVVFAAEHRRAFCFVSDAVEATVTAMRTGAAAGRTFNIGNDREEITIGALAALILELAGLTVPIESRAPANDPIVRRCPDITAARLTLGYEPRVALREGLAQTLRWYAEAFEPAASAP